MELSPLPSRKFGLTFRRHPAEAPTTLNFGSGEIMLESTSSGLLTQPLLLHRSLAASCL